MKAPDDAAMTRDWTGSGRGLKLLVIVMTALLAIGLALLVVGMVRTAGRIGQADERPAGFADLKLALPAGSRLQHMTAAGDRLYLETVTADGKTRVLVVDAARGRLLGRIALEPGP